MKSIDLAYIAGVIDSDGSLSLVKRHRDRPTETHETLLQITWLKSDKAIKFFDYLVKNHGGSYFIGKSHSGFSNPKPICKYTLSGNKLRDLLSKLKNHLILKKDQAELVIDYRNSVKHGKTGNGRPKPLHLRMYHDLLHFEMYLAKGKDSASY